MARIVNTTDQPIEVNIEGAPHGWLFQPGIARTIDAADVLDACAGISGLDVEVPAAEPVAETVEEPAVADKAALDAE